MNESKAKSNLLEIKNKLEENEVNYWLDAGTLLAAARDGRFIPWDNDIDLGTWEESCEKLIELKNDFERLGYKVKYNTFIISLEKDECPINVSIYKREKDFAVRRSFYKYSQIRLINSFMIRLAFLMRSSYYHKLSLGHSDEIVTKIAIIFSKIRHRIPDSIKQRLDIKHEKISTKQICIVDSKHFNSSEFLTFYDNMYPVPHDYKAYLVARYGKDWQTPIKDWVTERDDQSVVIES